ncbi:lysophospholipid acyltransferase family protein [Thermomicrobium roseum]|uniref:lysophospholipid acyltransferase family protein n=1 Tax=Thermomicrobium roseum TaxID=500 RepID=UPI00059B9CC5|nr:lysophospholipid acyltransferase family protein [Thermomicrobium roseum]
MRGDRFGRALRLPLLERPACWVVDRIGEAAYLLWRSRRADLCANLAHVLGLPADSCAVRSAARRAFQASARNIAALLVLRLTGGRWRPVVEMEGAPVALSGSPVILVSAHLGPFDVAAATLASTRRLRLVSVAAPMRPWWIDRSMRWLRGVSGIELVPPTAAGLLRVRRALQTGTPVVFLVDRDPAGNGQLVTFFGARTTLPDGPLRLARRLNCPIVPVFCYRAEHGYRVRSGEPLRVARTANRQQDITVALEALARQLECAIREAPDQWLVFSPVWRRGRGRPRPVSRRLFA